jgi:hypothetical protein
MVNFFPELSTRERKNSGQGRSDSRILFNNPYSHSDPILGFEKSSAIQQRSKMTGCERTGCDCA